MTGECCYIKDSINADTKLAPFICAHLYHIMIRTMMKLSPVMNNKTSSVQVKVNSANNGMLVYDQVLKKL